MSASARILGAVHWIKQIAVFGTAWASGDALAQVYVKRRNTPLDQLVTSVSWADVNQTRLQRAATFAMLVMFPMHWRYTRWIGLTYRQTTGEHLIRRWIAEQFIWAPMHIAAYMFLTPVVYHAGLNVNVARLAYARTTIVLPEAWGWHWVVWLPARAILFWVVPRSLWVAFEACVWCVWSAKVSVIDQDSWKVSRAY